MGSSSRRAPSHLGQAMLTSLWQGDAWFYHQDCLPTSAVKNTLLLCFMFPMHLTLEIDWILTPSWHWSRQASYESNSLLVRQRDRVTAAPASERPSFVSIIFNPTPSSFHQNHCFPVGQLGFSLSLFLPPFTWQEAD